MGSWSTEEINYTRSENENKVAQKDETDGLDMGVCTLPDTIRRATTRWTNIDNNTVFRVVAYACSSVAAITTANYKGYGDYQLLDNGTVKTLQNMILPVGTYTFVCYSYGDSSTMDPFNNSTTTTTATNGQKFMTCIMPNISIPDTGTKYTLSNITFRNRSARYRIKVTAESGRMDKITSCSGTLSLPQKSQYTFTDDAISAKEPNGSFNVTWTSPNAMAVYSDYVYILPESSGNITINLNVTIGGKAFTNKSVTLSGLKLKPSGIYCSNVSFTTTAGYIVAGAFWAHGNLYKEGNQYKLYDSTEKYDADAYHGEFFACNNPNPYPDVEFKDHWTDDNDPCRKVELTNSVPTWRLPTGDEVDALIAMPHQMDASFNNITGYIFGGILFLPYSGYMPSGTSYVENEIRGLFWSTETMFVISSAAYAPGFVGVMTFPWNQYPSNCYGIRCVRNI